MLMLLQSVQVLLIMFIVDIQLLTFSLPASFSSNNAYKPGSFVVCKNVLAKKSYWQHNGA